MITKKLLGIIAIILIISGGIIIASLSKQTKPPVIRFIDERTNISLSGVVYLNDKYMGEANEGFFDKMPKNYCKGEHTIMLKSSEYILKWGSLPSDCRYDLITLNYGEAAE
tara:strand:+ start:52 stop:384 length:333 start_codon:yes stop_codon:yes gene_type:complete